MIKKFLFVASLKEVALLLYGKLLDKLLIKSKFYTYYLPLYKLAANYINEGYKVSTEKGSLLISGKDDDFDKKFLIRPCTSDNHVFDQVIVAKEYSPLIDIIKKEGSLSSIQSIVDAGANVGFTAIFLNRYFPQARIICIEADPNNSQQLKKNIKINNLKDQVEVINNALWDVDNENLIIKNDFRDGDSWSKRVGKNIEELNSTHSIKSISLLKLFIDYKLETLDVLKIDIEGAEYTLFKSVNFINMLDRVKFLAIEIHDEIVERESIESILLSKGFILNRFGETLFCINKKLITT